MKTGFFSARYDEPKADTTFKMFQLTIRNHSSKGKEKIIRFNTGDPIVDYWNYFKWMAENMEKEKVIHCSHSSSVDHFFMDSKKYHQKVVVFNKEYTDGEIMWWYEAEKKGIHDDDLVKVCVTDEFKTWSQLKEYIKSKIKVKSKRKK